MGARKLQPERAVAERGRMVQRAMAIASNAVSTIACVNALHQSLVYIRLDAH